MGKMTGQTRTARRVGTKSALRKKCQSLTKGARARARREVGIKNGKN